MKPLTPAQERILADVRAAGKKVYNGRATRPIIVLQKRGLVDVDWHMDFVPKGGGTQPRWIITVTPR